HTGRSAYAARSPDGSPVRRESHAGIYERPAVRFHRPTRRHIWQARQWRAPPQSPGPSSTWGGVEIRTLAHIPRAAAALPRTHIDTDVVIRIERLTSVAREQLGRYAFETIRFRKDGTDDPDFVLNRPAFRHAPILIAGANFGCGSSREGAVWALMAAGLR